MHAKRPRKHKFRLAFEAARSAEYPGMFGVKKFLRNRHLRSKRDLRFRWQRDACDAYSLP